MPNRLHNPLTSAYPLLALTALFLAEPAGAQAARTAVTRTAEVPRSDATSEAASAGASAPLPVARLVDEARDLLRRRDPVSALSAFAGIRALQPADRAGSMGLAETWLVLGKPGLAERYVEAVRREDPDREDALALHIRVLIRAAEFDRALRMATRAIASRSQPSVELLAAYASALFRVQRTVDAAGVYQRVLRLAPLHAEAHLRLGSGLLPPRQVPFLATIMRGIRDQQDGELDAAIRHFQAALVEHPGHPVAHRLLGECLYKQRHRNSIVAHSRCYTELHEAIPAPRIENEGQLSQFMPAYEELSPERRAVARRSVALFASLMPKLIKLRGRHDILRADERTTDALVRARLRGTRTFDGRVWDDVRGIGGLQAATGIEALDDALEFDFDTLSHEIAHQVHLFAFTPVQRAKIRSLYRDAERENRCLDYYAASNDAEYFGQGVEAFASLGKRPGCEKTHGHTRFELLRVDPDLYAFIAGIIEFDPLRTAEGRARILPKSIEVALRSGRAEDAVVAAEMMDAGPEKDRLLQRARRAVRLARTY